MVEYLLVLILHLGDGWAIINGNVADPFATPEECAAEMARQLAKDDRLEGLCIPKAVEGEKI